MFDWANEEGIIVNLPFKIYFGTTVPLIVLFVILILFIRAKGMSSDDNAARKGKSNNPKKKSDGEESKKSTWDTSANGSIQKDVKPTVRATISINRVDSHLTGDHNV
jgi:hypothetical protein